METEMKVGVEEPTNNVIYGASILSIIISLMLVRKNPVLATFVGLWPPTILGLANFFKENKLMEMEKRQMRQASA